MPQPQISAKAVKRFMERLHKAGYLEVRMGPRMAGDKRPTLGTVARRMKVSSSTISTYISQHCPKFGWDPKVPETWVIKDPGNDQPIAIKERVRYQRQIQRQKDDLRAMARELSGIEELRAAVFKLAEQPLEPPVWSMSKAPPKGGPGIPVLFTSDFQWGEKISKDQLDGVNEYNLRVARRRYETLIAKTVELAKSHMVKPDYPGIVYLRGGDAISGEIHLELRETNDALSIPAVVDLVEHEIAGIEALLDYFPKVWVISVPGNHGRTTIKPHSKGYVETNYDTLSAWMIERHFAAGKDDRVQFYTPASGDAIFQLYGWTFCLTHGDRIGSRGGMGFIGPAATIARGMKRVMEYYAGIGTVVDKVLVGHFHTYLELEQGFCNGSLPGISEYGRDGRFLPQPPTQLLFFVHPHHGVTARWPILLESRPRLGKSSPAFGFLKAA